jgi:hypothetical protein
LFWRAVGEVDNAMADLAERGKVSAVQAYITAMNTAAALLLSAVAVGLARTGAPRPRRVRSAS